MQRADVATITLGSSHKHLAAQGPLHFHAHADNFDVLGRFQRAFFDSVRRIKVLSADGPHSHVRGSEFILVKDELVDVIVGMRYEMGRASPSPRRPRAPLRIPVLLTNKMSLQGDEASEPQINRAKQHAVLNTPC